ncbi:hypothetical protein GCM10023335_05470 [Streptomyces siamensis]|uniref:Secreted protein n=1 Tax=Streptomyces siamensis TaxID=1274986 RepID=A0ABP9IEA5_9ACTN
MAASATVVCLGAVLAACASGGDGDGYVAVGAAGGTPGASGAVVAPTGDVSLMPLDGAAEDSGTPGGERSAKSGTDATASAPGSGSSDASPDPAADSGHSGSTSTPSSGTGGPGRTGTGSGGTSSHGPSSPATPPPGSSTAPAGPAALAVGDPRREGTARRWCEKVTVSFHNTGGTAVRSGTVTFGTHIIGALGIDWATIESSEDLPAPIAAGAKKDKTWTVCVDAWRVPLGMHIETQDVSVHWK